jgi:drug/metabolite transporter (DMT)-like permease
VALSWGLGFVAVQIVGAHFIFRETITLLQWLGVALVTGGIVLISLGRAS